MPTPVRQRDAAVLQVTRSYKATHPTSLICVPTIRFKILTVYKGKRTLTVVGFYRAIPPIRDTAASLAPRGSPLNGLVRNIGKESNGLGG